MSAGIEQSTKGIYDLFYALNQKAFFYFFVVDFPIAIAAIAIAFAAGIILAVYCNKEMDGLLRTYSLLRSSEVLTRLDSLKWQKEYFKVNSLHEDRLVSAYFNK